MSDQTTAFTELLQINERIGQAESDADKAWFEHLLHERFTMRRPSGPLSTKADFISGLATGATRQTTMLDLELHGRYRATARCTVEKWPTPRLSRSSTICGSSSARTDAGS